MPLLVFLMGNKYDAKIFMYALVYVYKYASTRDILIFDL